MNHENRLPREGELLDITVAISGGHKTVTARSVDGGHAWNLANSVVVFGGRYRYRETEP